MNTYQHIVAFHVANFYINSNYIKNGLRKFCLQMWKKFHKVKHKTLYSLIDPDGKDGILPEIVELNATV